ncbi:YegP family protein [Luethyella okanaganae]|uniref:YegP family protein n=1 Tax=Luethyella okanaganae TaxID=69372 RepID=A0ABW1VFS1_9MICO
MFSQDPFCLWRDSNPVHILMLAVDVADHATMQKAGIMAGKFELFQDKGGDWRFNLKAGNGEVIASSQGYNAKASALNGIDSVRRNAADAEVVELQS